MTEDGTVDVSFFVTGVERVHGRGELVALAIVELTLHGISMTLQGTQVCHMAGNRITVMLPAFKHPRDGMMRTAIVLPKELGDAIRAAVADAYDTLERPTLLPGDAGGGATSLSTR